MSQSPPDPVIRLPRTDVARVVDVLCDAFHDYPVMRFVLGASAGHAARLHTLIRFFVMARALRDEPLLGIMEGTTVAAAAIVSYPHQSVSPAALSEVREEVWRTLGVDARNRYDACGRTWAPLGIAAPHLHVNMLGVRPARQGRGLATRLLDHVHRLSDQTPGSVGVTLTTEDPANVPLYEHLGYTLLGHATIAPGLETWSLLRGERPPTDS